jgi:hypothetical protein
MLVLFIQLFLSIIPIRRPNTRPNPSTASSQHPNGLFSFLLFDILGPFGAQGAIGSNNDVKFVKFFGVRDFARAVVEVDLESTRSHSIQQLLLPLFGFYKYQKLIQVSSQKFFRKAGIPEEPKK